MALYLISYDISDQHKKEYDPLWALLEQMDAVKILYSEWLVVDDTGQASSIYSKIMPILLVPDRLLVQELTKDCAWDKLLIEDDLFREIVTTHARG